MTSERPAIAIVGGGPRGVSILERIIANADAPNTPGIDVHLIDDTQLGAGRVWRTDQTRELCMNTLADAVTLFTDESVTMAGPVRSGPTMYEWCQLALAREAPEFADRVRDVADDRRTVFASHPVRSGLVADYRRELEEQQPHSHPSRALYGEYLVWCGERAMRSAPRSIRVHAHLDRVVELTERAGRQVLALASGAELVADAVVVATGWLEPEDAPDERALAAAAARPGGPRWVRPGSPVDQDLAGVPAGADAIVRGLGMGFFDAMALLTIERGGAFVPEPGVPWGLRYEPSGHEPRLHVTSRRGVPYRAKSVYGSLPPRAPQRYLRAVDPATLPRPADFDRELWPRIVADAFCAYYETLARVSPGAVDLRGLLAAVDAVDLGAEDIVAALDEAVAPFVRDAEALLDLEALMFPGRGAAFASPDDFDAWAARFVADDLAEAERGADSPAKAALWSISSARAVAARLGAFGGFDAESRYGGFRTLFEVGNMAGSGPPAFRNRQLLALHEAGLVRFLGPDARVESEGGAFRARVAATGADVTAPVLVDAWMRVHDAARSADPLIRSLARAGRIRPFAVPARAGGRLATRGVDVDPGTGRAVRADGSLDGALHLAGIPLDDTMHDALISPMPGADATMLRETDRVARSLLRTVAVAPSGTAPAAAS